MLDLWSHLCQVSMFFRPRRADVVAWCCKRKTHQWSVIVSVVSILETCFLAAATFVKVFKMSARSCDKEWFVFDSKQTWLEFFHHPVNCSIQVLGFSSLLWPVLVAMRCAKWRGHHAEGFWFVGCNHWRFPEVSVLQGKGIALYDGISFMKKWWRHKIHIKWRSRPTTVVKCTHFFKHGQNYMYIYIYTYIFALANCPPLLFLFNITESQGLTPLKKTWFHRVFILLRHSLQYWT